MHDVLSLADAWNAQLDASAMARLHARSLEMDARDGGRQVGIIRGAVLDELTSLVMVADGTLQPCRREGPQAMPKSEGGHTLMKDVIERIQERLFKAVADALEGLATTEKFTCIDPLDAWERWLAFRSALESLEARAGEGAVAALWHSHVRTNVWRFASALFDRHQEQTAWVAHMVFTWLAERAECLNDMQAMLLNRENACIAQRTAGW